jgi:glyoxylase-like metal-dependent hydrolase (beta-lactamase superfamily II)
MDRHINCIAHNSSEGRLLIGDAAAAIIDCGMAFCALDTIENVKKALKGRALDYIILTHTHYDHVGALAYFRAQWPGVQVVTCEIGAAALLKDTPRRVIRELSATAARLYGGKTGARDSEALGELYRDDALYADVVIKDGDIIGLGGISVEAVATPGHTRDSMCYYIPETELFMLCETPGVLLPDGSMYPCYLSGYGDTIKSIAKCRAKKYGSISLPHRGMADARECDGFFDKAMKTNVECHDFVMDMLDENLEESEMLKRFRMKYFNETLITFQPAEAFDINAKAIIACTVREIPNTREISGNRENSGNRDITGARENPDNRGIPGNREARTPRGNQAAGDTGNNA